MESKYRSLIELSVHAASINVSLALAHCIIWSQGVFVVFLFVFLFVQMYIYIYIYMAIFFLDSTEKVLEHGFVVVENQPEKSIKC